MQSSEVNNLLVIEELNPYLWLLPEVRGEFEASDIALVIPHYDDGIDGIKLNVSQLSLLFSHHWLLADSVIFVDAEIKHVNLEEMMRPLFINVVFKCHISHIIGVCCL